MATEESHEPISDEGLALWLEFAVPLAMAELRVKSTRERDDLTRVWLADGARQVGAYGDRLMFHGKRSGLGGLAAAALAKGVAAEAALNGEATHLGLTFVWPGARPPAVAPEPTPPPHRRPIEVIHLPDVIDIDQPSGATA